MFLPLSRAEKQLSDPTQRIHKVLETARILYGLIHARYVLTAQGLTDMVRRLAWCWLRTCVHARVFFRSRSRTLSLSPRSLLLAVARSLSLSCRLARSLHLSLRALSNTTALPLNSPSRTASSRSTLALLELLGYDQPPRSHQRLGLCEASTCPLLTAAPALTLAESQIQGSRVRLVPAHALREADSTSDGGV